MIRTKRNLLLALIYPIIVLALLVAAKEYHFHQGRQVVLPIYGYDPRDLLSGHYLIYAVDYGISKMCPQKSEIKNAYVCLDDKTITFEPRDDCKLYIRGVCQSGLFYAGIERFYIPEDKATDLDAKIRKQKASILISITPEGRAQVKDLLINGHPWRQE